MTKQEFEHVLEFAIKREEEAVAFYNELKGHANFHSQKEMIEEIENMEKGHIIAIQNIQKKGLEQFEYSERKAINVSNYLVANYDKDNLTFENIIILAMKREEMAYKLYKDLSLQFTGTQLESLFRKLADEEIKHKLHFEDIYNNEVAKDN
ncbi:MAG: hypothetical protein B6226_05330 [Candidatus Cloacimonetes bacterium 4572_65]|nr:MAG: hypothetical protein B6226_05330 [Candidatus Cloacimonetes bacterium 4572_65]